MRNWALRISAYADRLLKGLETLDWSDSLKEIQRNWIGRSEGGALHFDIKGHDATMEIFTTRPDTIFGATFMVLAPAAPYAGAQTWGSDFLPACHQGTQIIPGKEPLPNLTPAAPSPELQAIKGAAS